MLSSLRRTDLEDQSKRPKARACLEVWMVAEAGKVGDAHEDLAADRSLIEEFRHRLWIALAPLCYGKAGSGDGRGTPRVVARFLLAIPFGHPQNGLVVPLIAALIAEATAKRLLPFLSLSSMYAAR